MLNAQSIRTKQTATQVDRRSSRRTVSSGPSVMVPAYIVADMRRPARTRCPTRTVKGIGGPDTAVTQARWATWLAIQHAITGALYVHASPATVAEDFAARREAAAVREIARRANGEADRAERLGMSERTLARHRENFLARYATVTKDGRYRLRRDPRGLFHALDLEAACRLVYETTPAGFRATVAELPILSAQAKTQRESIQAPAKQRAEISHQSQASWCRGMRSSYIAGLILDNQPGRKWQAATASDGTPTTRHPVRVVSLISPIVPLRAGQIRTRSNPANSGNPTLSDVPYETCQDSGSSLRSEPEIEQHDGQRQKERQPAEPAGGMIGTVAPMEAGAFSAADGAKGAEPREATSAHRQAALNKWGARQILARSGFRASVTAAAQIARRTGTVGVLERILADEAPILLNDPSLSDPAAYLAAAMMGEDAATVRDPRWPGTKRRRLAQAAATTPKAIAQAGGAPDDPERQRREAARAAARLILTQHPTDPHAQRAAAVALADTGQQEAALMVTRHSQELEDRAELERYLAALAPLPRAAAWPELIDAARLAYADTPSPEHEARIVATLAVRWRRDGDAVLAAYDDADAHLVAERLPAIAEALAKITRRPWTLRVDGPDGPAGSAEGAPPQEPNDHGPQRIHPLLADEDGEREGADREPGGPLRVAVPDDGRRPAASAPAGIAERAHAARLAAGPLLAAGARLDAPGAERRAPGGGAERPHAMSPRADARARLIADLERRATAGSATAAAMLATFRAHPTSRKRH